MPLWIFTGIWALPTIFKAMTKHWTYQLLRISWTANKSWCWLLQLEENKKPTFCEQGCQVTTRALHHSLSSARSKYIEMLHSVHFSMLSVQDFSGFLFSILPQLFSEGFLLRSVMRYGMSTKGKLWCFTTDKWFLMVSMCIIYFAPKGLYFVFPILYV